MTIPVILRAVDWTLAPFHKLQALPTDGRPVTSWANRDEAFTNIAIGIREVVERMTAKDSTGNRASRQSCGKFLNRQLAVKYSLQTDFIDGSNFVT